MKQNKSISLKNMHLLPSYSIVMIGKMGQCPKFIAFAHPKCILGFKKCVASSTLLVGWVGVLGWRGAKSQRPAPIFAALCYLFFLSIFCSTFLLNFLLPDIAEKIIIETKCIASLYNSINSITCRK